MIQIRAMQTEDCTEVATIDRACFFNAWSLSMFEELFRFPANHYYVAVDSLNAEANQIIGFAGILVSVDTADIMNIGVLPTYRSQGIGSLLIQKLEEDAEISKCEQMMLEVRESNVAAIELYRKHGFEQISVRKNYYSNPTEHGLIMQKPIISTMRRQ